MHGVYLSLVKIKYSVCVCVCVCVGKKKRDEYLNLHMKLELCQHIREC